MVREVLTQYGPVNRFWFDGTRDGPCVGHNLDKLWNEVYKTIRTVSPQTMITAYRGDVCAASKAARKAASFGGEHPHYDDVLEPALPPSRLLPSTPASSRGGAAAAACAVNSDLRSRPLVARPRWRGVTRDGVHGPRGRGRT